MEDKELSLGSGIPYPEGLQGSPSIAKLAAALAKAQGEMKNPEKTSENPHFKMKYADGASVRDAITPALSANEISVLQPVTMAGYRLVVYTMLVHSSGEYLMSTYPVRTGRYRNKDGERVLEENEDAQGTGSGVTYARRYALQAMVNIWGEADDDGNSAGGNQENGSRRPNSAPAATEKQIKYIHQLVHTKELTEEIEIWYMQSKEDLDTISLIKAKHIIEELKKLPDKKQKEDPGIEVKQEDLPSNESEIDTLDEIPFD